MMYSLSHVFPFLLEEVAEFLQILRTMMISFFLGCMNTLIFWMKEPMRTIPLSINILYISSICVQM